MVLYVSYFCGMKVTKDNLREFLVDWSPEIDNNMECDVFVYNKYVKTMSMPAVQVNPFTHRPQKNRCMACPKQTSVNTI